MLGNRHQSNLAANLQLLSKFVCVFIVAQMDAGASAREMKTAVPILGKSKDNVIVANSNYVPICNDSIC
jgi:hypothetical protein